MFHLIPYALQAEMPVLLRYFAAFLVTIKLYCSFNLNSVVTSDTLFKILKFAHVAGNVIRTEGFEFHKSSTPLRPHSSSGRGYLIYWSDYLLTYLLHAAESFLKS